VIGGAGIACLYGIAFMLPIRAGLTIAAVATRWLMLGARWLARQQRDQWLLPHFL